MSMTSRERWLALLAGEKPDRIPTDYWATPEVNERLLRELGCATMEALFNKLHIDAPASIGARPLANAHPRIPESDLWGLVRRRVDYGTGIYNEVENHPLAEATTVADIERYEWPDPDDRDWEHFQADLDQLDGSRIVRCGAYEPFLLYCALRGMEQAMMDLLCEPEIAEAIFQRLFDFHYRLNTRMWEMGRGRIDLTYVAEDLGSQGSLLLGLEQIHRYILPNQKRMADLARDFGIHIMYHSDGAIREVIPDLIRVTGMEILNPIQWRCPGMEREGLVRDFGHQIVFHGAVDNQQTLPFGSAEDVRQEVLDNLRIFAPARWICAPCHNLQPVTPTANILALYETIHAEGGLK